MKYNRFVLFIALLACAMPPARADQFDDMIAALRKGPPATPPMLDVKFMKSLNETPGSAKDIFDNATVDLYLQEIKLSIIDPDREGGWPYRSFLIEDEPSLRKMLMEGLTKRFAAKPDSLVYYAMVCPALYDKNETLVATIESYLKENDPFLYKLEQDDVVKNWRPSIAATLAHQKAEFISDMLKVISLYGTESKVPAACATKLDLTADGKDWPDHQVACKGDSTVSTHGFAIHQGKDQDIVLSAAVGPGVVNVFRARRDGTLVFALIFTPETGKTTMREIAEAQKDFATEWAFWNNTAEDLLSAKGQ